jgi:hypothetical protein
VSKPDVKASRVTNKNIIDPNSEVNSGINISKPEEYKHKPK